MSVRVSRTDDLELIREMAKDSLPDFVLTDAELDEADWWIACKDGVPVGFGGLWQKDGGKKAFLCRAGVIPSECGAGIQKRLIRARLRHAKKQGVPRVYTYVWAGNFASMRSLLKCGMKPYHFEGGYLYLETNRP